jgi:hypothetical protein
MSYQFGVDMFGWIGAGSLLWAYGMISMGKVSAGSLNYQLANLFGSMLLLVNTVFYGAYPSSTVNVLWIGVAILSLVRSRRAPGGA